MLPQQHGEDCRQGEKGGREAGRLAQGKDAGGQGEVGCLGAWPCPLNPLPLPPAARQKGWRLPSSTRELLDS